MEFELIQSNKDSAARAGLLKTDHGEIETPIFMPVGTAGTVKAGVTVNAIQYKQMESIQFANPPGFQPNEFC